MMIIGRWLLVTVMAITAAAWLAGYLFLLSFRMNPYSATPLTTYQYWSAYGNRQDVSRHLAGSVAIALAGFTAACGTAFWPKRRAVHGNAKFANRTEIRGAGLFSQDGLILGKYGNRYLTLGGQQGVLLAAPPRSGKGVGEVIPNLLNFAGSVVCVDIKNENYTITAGYRAKCGQQVYRFDPFNAEGRTARWNPLGYVADEHGARINDLQRIAGMLYSDESKDPFWPPSARSMFLGLALYVFETEGLPRTIGEVLRQGMATAAEAFGKHWKRVIADRHKAGNPLSDECVRLLADLIDLAPTTAGSIRKTFSAGLELWMNPILDAATSTNDFDLRDLRKKPITIYVSVAPEDMHRMRPILNLFFQQAIGLQTRELPEHNPELRHQVLMLLDEFTALGHMPIIADSISYLPGYNVRVLMVIQAQSQLLQIYGPHVTSTMTKALAARIVFAPKDFKEAREISDDLGNTTIKVSSKSAAVGLQGRRSTSTSERARPLLLAQEVKSLGGNKALIFYENLRPILCKKIVYYKDPIFRARLLPPPVVPIIPRVVAPKMDQAAIVNSPTEQAKDREITPEDIQREAEALLLRGVA